jgi:glycosyltransferase involved in cell wall biosynthesis
MKKKLFLITTIPLSLIFFKGQISYLKKVFDVSLISGGEDLLYKIANYEKVNYYAINIKRDISILDDIKSLISFIKIFKKEKPNFIHCNTPKASFIGLLAGYLCNVPNRLYFVHGLRYHGSYGGKRKLLMLMERLSCFFATNIIAVSNGVKNTMINELKVNNVKVVGYGSSNGIDTKKFNKNKFNIKSIRKELGIQEMDFVYGFVGRLVGDKGINELVEAFVKLDKTYERVKLLLVGPLENELDPLKESIKKVINDNKNIVLTGYQEDVKPYLAVMDVFVFPSYREGFGIVLMEAAAMQIPSIASDIIGCNEVIIDGETGILIPPANEVELFNKMEYANLNKSKVIEMGLKAEKSIKKRFSHEIVWDNYLNEYREIGQI